MNMLVIVEGDFACINGLTEKWVADNGNLSGFVCQRVTNGAALVTETGRVVSVYLTRDAAERALDPAYQASLAEAKRRSTSE